MKNHIIRPLICLVAFIGWAHSQVQAQTISNNLSLGDFISYEELYQYQDIDTNSNVTLMDVVNWRDSRYGEEALRQAGMSVFNSIEGAHFAVIAQELEQVFPELVIDKRALRKEDLEDRQSRETVITKAVNYHGLIPVLIAGILQEQQVQIEELKARLATLEAIIQE